ncbi:MAG TPA: serine/threonine-protein kinase [Gemmatimonadaceae bacterium]|nr:serine/threonine-protein kinase [Gemmatimonadaceae bacterium]
MSAATVSPEFVALQQALAGRYSLERELGRGGMGIVYLAREVALDRLVAIKLLPPERAAMAGRRARFVREARLAASLSHPHIVPIHAVDERDGLVWFVMAWVDGETLGDRVRRAGPLGASEGARILREVAWALGHAHARGIIHRDVKPDNILLERGTGRALVTDFGIARASDSDGSDSGAQHAGTPQYMSPEQVTGEALDVRSDLYSLGVTMYYALAGRLPFEGPTTVALLAQHAAAPVPALSGVRPGLPGALSRAIERCLAKVPDERFVSAEALVEAVAEVRDPRSDLPAPVRAFVREADSAGREIGGAMVATASAGSAAFFMSLGRGFDYSMASSILGVTAVVTGAFALGRLGMLIAGARDLVRTGYDHGGVRAGLALEERAQVEETSARQAPPRWETISLGTLGVAKTALAAWLVTADSAWLFMPGLAGVVAIPAVTVRRLWTDLRRGPSHWYRALRGRLGVGIFAIAALGMRGHEERKPVAGQPTVLAIGDAVEALFAALPDEQRRVAGDVPEVVRRLESHALALRAGPPSSDAAARLETVVSALESVRLELLRLHAGAGSLENLTRDLEAAREIGRRVEAIEEVRETVRPQRLTPVDTTRRTPA